MKKLVVVLTLCVALVTVFSCKDSKEKSETTTEVKGDNGAEKADLAMNDEYQCPMDCEDGKTYDEPGSCPVCKMDLKKLQTMEAGEHEHDNGEVHENHDDDEASDNEHE